MLVTFFTMCEVNVWCLCLFCVVISAFARKEDKIGYFWHITDIHYDAHFNFHGRSNKGCWRTDYEGVSPSSNSISDTKSQRIQGMFGEYECEATWALVESAAKLMASKQRENVEFVLWTGDALTHAAKHLHESKQLELLRNLTDLFCKTFPSQFVFPALGHDDPASRYHLGRMWSRWLPTDSLYTFQAGGYYMIENKITKLQIVVLNTNLMRRGEEDEEANRQWRWLDDVLMMFKTNGETVYLVGHIPPGLDERQKGPIQDIHTVYSNYHNKIYLKIVRKYHKIISGQFFGHLHSDTFRVIYGEQGTPISWIMISPSVTSRKLHLGPTNPGLRLYKFHIDTGQIFDYTQYYLDLEASNEYLKPEWSIEYNFTTYYGLNEVNPITLHNIADQFLIYPAKKKQNTIFDRYYKANSVRLSNQIPCDNSCLYSQYCTVTRLDYGEHQKCVESARFLYGLSSRLRYSCGVLLVLLSVLFLV